jgi:hypothetical protein
MVPRWTRPQCATYQPPQLVACAILLKADLALGIVVPLEHLEQVSAQSLHGSHLIELSRRETSTPTASSSSSVTLVELQQLLVSCVLRDLYPTAASAAASTAAESVPVSRSWCAPSSVQGGPVPSSRHGGCAPERVAGVPCSMHRHPQWAQHLSSIASSCHPVLSHHDPPPVHHASELLHTIVAVSVRIGFVTGDLPPPHTVNEACQRVVLLHRPNVHQMPTRNLHAQPCPAAAISSPASCSSRSSQAICPSRWSSGLLSS